MNERRELADDAPLWQRWMLVREDEWRDVVLSGLYFFCILASYGLLRPVRDAMGLEAGVKELPNLWLLTVVGTLIATPLFSHLVARRPRREFLPLVYRVCELNLMLFFLAWRFLPASASVPIVWVFYPWLGVFAVFAVSVFWGFMADLFVLEQARRLFGLIGVGGTLGALAGTGLAGWLPSLMDPLWLLLIAAALLEGAVWALMRIRGTGSPNVRNAEQPLGGNALSGARSVVSSRYLLLICAFILLLSFAQSFLDFQKSNIVDAYYKGRADRTLVFSRLEFAVQSLTLVVQLFLTNRLMRKLGLGGMLLVLPVLCMVGFSVLGLAHGGLFAPLGVMMGFVIAQRGLTHSIMRPSREALFTLVPRDEKYAAKNFVDTFVFRGGDALAAQAFRLLQTGLGLSLEALAFVAIPAAAVWGAVALVLGHQARKRAHAEGDREP